MTATVIRIQLKANRTRPIRNPSFVHMFSSSSSTPGGEPPDNDNNDHTTPSSFSSYLSDVKSSVKQQQQSQPRGSPHSQPFSPSSSASKPSKTASLEEIGKNLTEFRRRAAVPPPSDENTSSFPSPPPRPSQHISFQELYRTNMIPKGEESNTTEPTTKSSGQSFLYTIGESLKQIRKPQSADGGVNKWNETTPRHKFTDSLLRLTNSMPVYGTLPASMIGKKEREKKPADDESMKTKFLKIYSREELGEKLRKLRPEEAMKKGGKWFSLGELNERLVKLREIEEKESETRIGGDTFHALRESLQTIEMSNKEKARKSTVHKLNMLGQLDGTPNLMSSPPKENLVEKYFHRDNMSSAEKMKTELKKVRDEFKMSESDCGSARVQVAQLTTKIKHLSTVLHKKDKHSRKGLQEMVQQRKKLLKYLRRTDWDSYCLVLSKLGLRDNPDFKNQTGMYQ